MINNHHLIFSIIVVSLNAERTILSTINSILKQEFDDYEIIVKDANSTDNTTSMLPCSNKIRIIKNKDSGIYDGMNEALVNANGDFICFLNCGDTFYSEDVLSKLFSFIQLNNIKNHEIVYGDCFRLKKIIHYPSKLSKLFLFRKPLCHQAVFFGKEALQSCGPYDLTLKLMSDYDLILKLFNKHFKFRHSKITVCNYLPGGISEQKEMQNILKLETRKIRKRYFSKTEYFLLAFLHGMTFPKLRTKILIFTSNIKARKDNTVYGNE